jgi:hypothetical protein
MRLLNCHLRFRQNFFEFYKSGVFGELVPARKHPLTFVLLQQLLVILM